MNTDEIGNLLCYNSNFELNVNLLSLFHGPVAQEGVDPLQVDVQVTWLFQAGLQVVNVILQEEWEAYRKKQ